MRVTRACHSRSRQADPQHLLMSMCNPAQVLALAMRAPRSFTAEDVVEVHTHGGGVPARRVLDALLAAGARLARPGEFTLRAFLNGRLDLTQASVPAFALTPALPIVPRHRRPMALVAAYCLQGWQGPPRAGVDDTPVPG